jgi:hypothetical protein
VDSAQLVVEMKRLQLDSDVGNGGGIRGKASAQRIKIGQHAGIEIGLDECGEFSLAGAIMGQTMVRQARFSVSPASSASEAC